MKNLLVLLLFCLLVQLPAVAQFPPLFQYPKPLVGDSYADTIINTKEILRKEGIKKIYVYQTLPEVTRTFANKTVNLDGNGNIASVKICFPENGTTHFILCIDDTLLYDAKGRLVEMKLCDNKGNLYPHFKTEYIDEQETRTWWIDGIGTDTMMNYKYYNRSGQLVQMNQIKKGRQVAHSLFYYNKDGLLDSVMQEDVGMTIYVYHRNQKKKSLVIKSEDAAAAYKWIFNSIHQCIKAEFIVKNLPSVKHSSGYKGTLKTVVNYYYNDNGTLSKVTQESSDKPKVTMFYSYFK